MIAYVDNDIVHKLSTFDLLDSALAGLGVTRADIRVLHTARFKLLYRGDRAKGAKKYGADVYDRMKSFLESVADLTTAPSAADLATLTAIMDVDQGEAVLIAAAAHDPTSLLVTGDKKSLRALTGAPSAASFVSALAGRVVCFEQLVRCAIKHASFEDVRARVSAQLTVGADSAVRVIFSSGDLTVETNAEAALQSYISELRSLPGGLLHTAF